MYHPLDSHTDDFTSGLIRTWRNGTCTFDHVSMLHSTVFMVYRYTIISKRRTKMHTEWSVGLRYSHKGDKVALRVRRLKSSYLYKNLPVYQKRYVWLYCCMGNLNITHRFVCTQTHSFSLLSSVLISHFELLPCLIPFASKWHAG